MILKRGRWAEKRRLRKERKQKVQPKEKNEVVKVIVRLHVYDCKRCIEMVLIRSVQLIKRTLTHVIKSILRILLRRISVSLDTLPEWLSEAHSDALTLADARGYVDEYLLHLVKLERSAYSITTAKLL